MMIEAGLQALCARILTPEGEVRRATVRWEDENLTGVQSGLQAAPDVRIVPTGYTLLPALVDLHAHGGGGVDAADLLEATPGEAADLWCELSAHAARGGAAAMVPALMSAGPEATELFLHRAANRPKRLPGADLPGVHLEGPYLDEEYRGAHRTEHLRSPDPDEVQRWLKVGGDALCMVTLAPGLPGAMEVVEQLSAPGRIVACGHTGAGLWEMNRAFGRGAGHVAHLFNGMRPMHHRHPGPIAAALLRSGVTCELIGDGLHVHPEMVRLAARMKGRRELCLITDATAAAGCGEGEYSLGGCPVQMSGGAVRTPDGALAGTAATPIDVLHWAVDDLGWTLERAVDALSRVPGGVLGRNAGQIAAGRRADLLLVDEELEVVATVVGGRVVSGHIPEE